jgi:hypothetical protein
MESRALNAMRCRDMSGQGPGYVGLAAALGAAEDAVIVVAHDMECLRRQWARLTDRPLNESQVSRVAVLGHFTEGT